MTYPSTLTLPPGGVFHNVIVATSLQFVAILISIGLSIFVVLIPFDCAQLSDIRFVPTVPVSCSVFANFSAIFSCTVMWAGGS